MDMGVELLQGVPKIHNNITVFSTYASERPQVRTWEHQTCLLPQAPSNLVMPLDTFQVCCANGFQFTSHLPWRLTFL